MTDLTKEDFEFVKALGWKKLKVAYVGCDQIIILTPTKI
jgi:hypothetical protein